MGHTSCTPNGFDSGARVVHLPAVMALSRSETRRWRSATMITDYRVSGGFMRMMRSGVGKLPYALAASLLLASAALAQDAPTVLRTPYPATLQFGTGLINIPVAWVSPRNSDVWINTSGKTIDHYIDVDAMNWATKWNTNIAIDTHWLGRFSNGAAPYSQKPEWGFFGQVMLLREEQFGGAVPS